MLNKYAGLLPRYAMSAYYSMILGVCESRPSQLLRHRLRAIQKVTGDGYLHVQTPDDALGLYAFIQTSPLHPMHLFGYSRLSSCSIS